MAENSLALRQSNVLARIGAPEERQYLVQIMAETIGIPAKDATRTDVIALLGAAVQRTIQYGWVPGLHMHVQKFETARSQEARKRNPDLDPIYTYSLVDGEKAWKDSGTRWRERGVRWTYQRKPMTKEEVKEEARLQGFTEALASNAYGMWSRIIIIGQDDPEDEHNPLWSAGVYTGKIKAGNFWRADVIPSGISSRDIAIRRADKRAMMQSQLTLLPVDDLGADARVQQLVDHLRHEAANRERAQAPMQRIESVSTEADGDMLWATTDARPAPSAARPAPYVDEDGVINMDMEVIAEPSDEDDAPVDEPVAARPAPSAARPEEVDARPVASIARPVNQSDGPCPECHAPVGKQHATSCTATGTLPDARPEEVAARPAPVARPAEQPGLDFGSALADDLVELSNEKISEPIDNLIRRTKAADSDSAIKMAESYLKALVIMIRESLDAKDDDEVYALLTVLVGYRVDAKTRPGQLVHGFLVKPLRDRDEKWLRPLRELMELCRGITIAAVEGTGPNG